MSFIVEPVAGDKYSLLCYLISSPEFVIQYAAATDRGSGVDGNRRYLIRNYLKCHARIMSLTVETANWLNQKLNEHCNLPPAIPFRHKATAPAAAEACVVDINELYQPSEKEPTMPKVQALRTVTYYGDRDVTTMSEDEIFQAIRDLEEAIRDLEQVQEKPRKLYNRLDSYRNTIRELILIVDARP